MRILIITFSKGVNPGTFMQALGVKTAMNRLYPDAMVEYLNFPDFKKSFGIKKETDNVKDVALRKLFGAYRLMKYKRLEKRNFTISKPIDLFDYEDTEAEKLFAKYDLIVIGSDTILEKAYGEKGKVGLNWMPFDVKKIYFAASASPANFEPTDDIKKVASDALYIGLRDNLTIDFFRDKLGIDAKRLNKQPDPSYYLDVSKLELPNRLKRKLDTNNKYALYNFNSNFPYKKELADRLRGLGYVVVSTAYNPCADICFDTVDAFEWAATFPYMDIIVTERFHDSVFGLRNGKPVIAIDWEKSRFASEGDSKTYRILEDYNLTELHFNLVMSADLTPICNAVENINRLFDPNKISERNMEIQQKADKMLDVIKEQIKGRL